MDFLYNYGLFLAKAVTVLAFTLLIIAIVSRIARQGRGPDEGRIKVRKLNDVYRRMENVLKQQLLSSPEWKAYVKSEKRRRKKQDAPESHEQQKKRLFVIDFEGDINASAVKSLRQEITALLTVAAEEDEVLVRLQSSGGLVHAYGLGASQLARLRAGGLRLIVAVDKIAASGGYKMACVADHLIAAPFAIIGSIGVVSEMPNFHRFLKKRNIDYELMTAGEYKRTLTLFGENKPAAKKKHRDKLQQIHLLFKEFVREHRDSVDIEAVATGEHWFGSQALELKLVDELNTSDDLILSRYKEWNIFQVKYSPVESLSARLSNTFADLAERVTMKVWEMVNSIWMR